MARRQTSRSMPAPAMAMDNGMPYSPLKPYVNHLKYQDGRERPYKPLHNLNSAETFHKPVFSLQRGRGGIHVDPTPMAFVELFYTDEMLDFIVNCTNSYAKERLPPSKVQEVSRSEILRFLAIYYYMGIVKLPNKRDYWRNDTSFWPQHSIVQSLSRTRFEYIWRNIHLVASTEVDEEADVDEDADAEDTDDEAPPNNKEDDEDNNDAVDEERPADTRWYKKVASFFDHIMKVSKIICKRPGTICSIDEMMKRFKGRSGQTHRMKGKPIKEGFKFFSICDTETGFVYDMIPDGRLEKSSTHDIVVYLVSLLPSLGIFNYIVCMDNYFTWNRVVKSLTEMMIGVVGTARAARGWPPKEIKAVTDDRFNTVYLLNDAAGYKIMRWVDNNVVTMVTNIHTGEETTETERKRPRATSTNRTAIRDVWGKDAVKKITIPKVIDDYNHWMNGVDLSDQLIAYYRPNLRCRRIWMPMFFHCLDVVRVNSYIAAKQLGWTCRGDAKKMHKEFVVEWIQSMLKKAITLEVRATRRQLLLSATPSPPSTKKRRRTSSKNPMLPLHRLLGDPRDHIKVDAPTQRQCVLCSYLWMRAKNCGEELPKIRRPKKWCNECRDHLCNEHFHVYHTRRYS